MSKPLIAFGLAVLFALAPAPALPQPAVPSLLEVETVEEVGGFGYTVPPEAAAIEELAARLEGERGAAAADFEQAREAFARDNPGALTIETLTFIKTWALMGRNGRLTSLAASTFVYEGGAHGNTAYDALLWDARANDAIDVTDLFTDRYAALAQLDRAFCTRLRPMPVERFGGEEIGKPWERCPLLHEQAIAPATADGDGRFSAFKIVVAPYIAGPYSMGSFEIDLPVDAALIAMLRPEYREAFAATH